MKKQTCVKCHAKFHEGKNNRETQQRQWQVTALSVQTHGNFKRIHSTMLKVSTISGSSASFHSCSKHTKPVLSLEKICIFQHILSPEQRLLTYSNVFYFYFLVPSHLGSPRQSPGGGGCKMVVVVVYFYLCQNTHILTYVIFGLNVWNNYASVVTSERSLFTH